METRPKARAGGTPSHEDDDAASRRLRELAAYWQRDPGVCPPDLGITPELRRTGIARDTIRLVQRARKDAGFESPTGSTCTGAPKVKPRKRSANT